MNRPDFIIIGAMKCATSSLHEQIALQPGTCLSEPKEPNFFSNDEEYARGWDWYAGLFADASPGDLRGESSTHYTKLPTYPKTLERLQAHLPDGLKFIYVMRHPVDRLVSQYVHEWSMNLTSSPIEEALGELPEMVEYSRYSYQLQPFFAAYGQETILPVFFERLLSEPQVEFERICKFLGYPGQPQWQDLEAQNTAGDRWKRTPITEFLAHNPIATAVRRTLVPKSFRNWVRESLLSLQSKPELSAERRAALEAVFDEDLAVLGRWLGIPDLCCANYKERVKAQSYDWVEPVAGPQSP